MNYRRIPSGIGLRKYAYDMEQQQTQTQLRKQPGFNEFMDDYMNMHKQRMMYNMMDRAFYHNLPQQQGHVNTQPQQQPQQSQPVQQPSGKSSGGVLKRMGDFAIGTGVNTLNKLTESAKSGQPGHIRTTPLPGAVY